MTSNKKFVTILIGNTTFFDGAKQIIQEYEKYHVLKFDTVLNLISWFYLYIEDEVNQEHSFVIAECHDKNLEGAIEKLSDLQSMVSDKKYSNVYFNIIMSASKEDDIDKNKIAEVFTKKGMISIVHGDDGFVHEDVDDWNVETDDIDLEFEKFSDFCDTCSMLFNANDSSKTVFESMPDSIREKTKEYLEKIIGHRLSSLNDIIVN